MGRNVWLACLFAFVLSLTSSAQATPSAASGEAVAYAMPVVAAGITVWKKDWTGLAQLVVVTGLTVGTAYGIKQIVRECRPFAHPCAHDSNDWDSFPSTTSALASAPSSFVWQRYGWKLGLPLFIISKYTAYSLDRSKKNRIWDGLASTVIAIGYNELITTRYHPRNSYYTSFDAGPDGVYASLHYNW